MRIVVRDERQLSEEVRSAQTLSVGVRYVNRDHVITACVDGGQVTLQLTTGREIRVTGSAAELAALVEELTTAAQSNFVQISSGTNYINLS